MTDQLDAAASTYTTYRSDEHPRNSAAFEPAIQPIESSQTYNLNRTVTGIGF